MTVLWHAVDWGSYGGVSVVKQRQRESDVGVQGRGWWNQMPTGVQTVFIAAVLFCLAAGARELFSDELDAQIITRKLVTGTQLTEALVDNKNEIVTEIGEGLDTRFHDMKTAIGILAGAENRAKAARGSSSHSGGTQGGVVNDG